MSHRKFDVIQFLSETPHISDEKPPEDLSDIDEKLNIDSRCAVFGEQCADVCPPKCQLSWCRI